VSGERERDLLKRLGELLGEIYAAGMAKLPAEAVRAVDHGLEAHRVGIRWQIDVDRLRAPSLKCSCVSVAENAESLILFVLAADAEDLKWFEVSASDKPN
jgi:hypothetical protein